MAKGTLKRFKINDEARAPKRGRLHTERARFIRQVGEAMAGLHGAALPTQALVPGRTWAQSQDESPLPAKGSERASV